MLLTQTKLAQRLVPLPLHFSRS